LVVVVVVVGTTDTNNKNRISKSVKYAMRYQEDGEIWIGLLYTYFTLKPVSAVPVSALADEGAVSVDAFSVVVTRSRFHCTFIYIF
jgi:hypothetical protein